MFEKNLLNIKNDLKYHRRDRQYLIKYYITKRLNMSFTDYFKNLESSVYALAIADPSNVIKEI